MNAPFFPPATLYDEGFHADRDTRTRATARMVLGMLREWMPVESLCDVGCGVGTWLKAGQELGIGDVQGFEGPWGRTASLVIEPDIITFQDLETQVAADRRFDLAMTLEVAEHLTPARSAGFVSDLCGLSDCVLFSAAIPHQGGIGHVNEQWHSYWAALFSDCSYDAFDVVRPVIWKDDRVAVWYRQNMLVYARRGSPAAAVLAARGAASPAMLDLVHPDLFMAAEAAQPRRGIKRLVNKALGRK